MPRKSFYLFAVLICLLFFHCRVKNSKFHVFFYTKDATQKVIVYVNNKIKGEVPYINDHLTCSDKEKLKAALHVIVSSGSHRITIKNTSGDELFEEKLKLKRRGGSVSVSSTSTNQDLSVYRTSQGNCIIEEIKF